MHRCYCRTIFLKKFYQTRLSRNRVLTSSSSSSSSSTITHMSIGDNVEFCLRQLDRHGVDSAALNQHSDKIIMPFEIQAFGEFFSDAALGETRAFKLQSLLFKKVEAVRGARRLAEWDKDFCRTTNPSEMLFKSWSASVGQCAASRFIEAHKYGNACGHFIIIRHPTLFLFQGLCADKMQACLSFNIL